MQWRLERQDKNKGSVIYGHLARWASTWQHNLCFPLFYFFFFIHFSSLALLNIYSAVIGLCHIFINLTDTTFHPIREPVCDSQTHFFLYTDRRGIPPHLSPSF
ncbi:hypothetical protein SORBI_3001G352633 [Sorghum bicolor]|uniref:Uncharacterized protein n=1 Tax=Sorghum bicolor TaxID=4558 RepID=A0A1Z5S9A1_SORBI|nr:hypothetical protein SORBI_3001G352633 [Sorghum bicolor]